MKLLAFELLLLSLVAVFEATATLDDYVYWPIGNFIQWTDLTLMQNDTIIIVDQNGDGNSTTIQGAVDLVPVNNPSRMKIVINPGLYNETVLIPQNKPNISMIGRPDLVTGELPVITSSRKASDTDQNGNMLGTMNTATFFVQSDYFVASSFAIENRAIPCGHGHQALAIRIDGDRSVFHKMRFLGYQDTIMDTTGIHYFYHCYIEGSVDFICGSATSLYQDCTINSTKEGAIAAHARNNPDDDSGFIFQDCKIQGVGPTFLGRAWGNYSKIIYSFCTMDNIINPQGWFDWGQAYKQNTSFFAEYMNEGPGSNMTGRVSWSKTLTDDQAASYVGRNFINADGWLRI